MLDHHRRRIVELEEKPQGGGPVEEVVVGELGPVQVLGRGQSRRGAFGLVEGGGLVRVLAVAEMLEPPGVEGEALGKIGRGLR